MVHHHGRISIIGAGTLGGTIAYSLMLTNTAKEILLVDMSENIVQGQVLDLAEVKSNTTVRAGTFKEAGQSTLVILTADTPPNVKKTRQEWLQQSRRLLLSIASSMSPVHSDIIIVITSDPVDLYVQSLQSYFPHVSTNRIFGLGNAMATDRFTDWLKEMMISSPPVEIQDAYCVGAQHTPVVVWGHAKVDGTPVSTLPNLIAQRAMCEKIVSNHRRYLICERKGKAWFGEAHTVSRLVSDILQQPSSTSINTPATVAGKASPIWVLSVNVPQYECCLSWPVAIGSTGIKNMVDLPISADEQRQVMQVVHSNMADFQLSFD